MKTLAGMTTWSNQLLQLGFLKEKETDGSERYRLFLGESMTSFWTQIHVIPIDECWQVTYSRSEVQVGLWKTYNIKGQLKTKGYYKNGKKNGPWEVYDEDGQLDRQRNYINGKEIK